MRYSMSLAFFGVMGIAALADEATLPLHPEDLAIVRKIAATAKLDAIDASPKGWPLKQGDRGVRFSSRENPKHALTVVHDATGRVTKLAGNGPLLTNEALTLAAGLPELRAIRIDHNILPGASKAGPNDYSGEGFAALANSKLEEVRIGHGFDDKGMIALASIPSVKAMDICHSQVTDAGLKALAKHPNLESFKVSSQGRANRVTEQCVATFATLPKLKSLALQETFVTFEGGLKSLTATHLESLSLKGSLVLPADVAKLKVVMPKLVIETSTATEILEAPNSRGIAKWASPEAQEYLKSGIEKK